MNDKNEQKKGFWKKFFKWLGCLIITVLSAFGIWLIFAPAICDMINDMFFPAANRPDRPFPPQSDPVITKIFHCRRCRSDNRIEKKLWYWDTHIGYLIPCKKCGEDTYQEEINNE